MKKGVFSKIMCSINWICWFCSKLLIIKGNYGASMGLEAASRMLGCPHFVIHDVRLFS